MQMPATNSKIQPDAIPNNDNEQPAATTHRWSGDWPLRDDQKRALAWMLNKERAQADSPIKCIGCLADKVGYGKTVVSLALIDADKDRAIAAHPQLFTTSATLVVAPTHVVEQWASEARKFLGTTATVVVLKTIVPLKRLTVADIQRADLIVSTFALITMQAKHYSQRFKELTGKTPIAGGIEAVVQATAAQLESGDHADIEFPLLNQFHWKRHIVDEVQEAYEWCGPMCFSGHRSKMFLRGISAEARWALTGTPEAMSVSELLHFFGRLEECAIHKPLERRFVDEFLTIHVRRNTDRYVHGIDNVRLEQIPVFVDLSRYERLCILAHRVLAHWYCCSSKVCAEWSGFNNFYYGYVNLGGQAEVRDALTGEIMETIDAKAHSTVGCLRRELSRKLSMPKNAWTFLNARRAILNDWVRMGEVSDIEFKGAATPTAVEVRRVVIVSFRLEEGYIDTNLLRMYSHPAAGTRWSCLSENSNPDHLDVAGSYIRRLRTGDAVFDMRGEVTEKGMQPDSGSPLPFHDPSFDGVRTVSDLIAALGAPMGSLGSRIASSSKVRAISELVDDLVRSGKGPVVIFTPGLNDVHFSIRAKLLDRGTSFGALDRFSNAQSVAKVLREFDSGGFDVLVLDISKFSAGVSLSCARSIVLVSPEEKVETEVQAIGRVRRLGFRGDVLPVYRFIARGGPIEENLSMRNMAEIEGRLAQRPRDESEHQPAECPHRVVGQASSSSSGVAPLLKRLRTETTC